MRAEGVQQLSPEWLHMRCGSVTGSRVCDVMARLKKGGESVARRNYKADLVVENITGLTTLHFVTPAMEHGIENEPLAKAAYEMQTDATVEDGGLWLHDEISRFMASPDGLVGEDGLIEVKCPQTTTHLEYLMAGVVPEDHQPQMLAEMACTGRQWVDFVSYDPRLPKRLQLFIRRFPRDEKRIAEMEEEVKTFLLEVAEILLRLSGDGGLEPILQASVEACK